jgi:hypothetical protein
MSTIRYDSVRIAPMDNSILGAFNAARGIYYIAKKILAFKRKGGFRRLPAMPEVNADDCTDVEEYYGRQRARDFARRFYREHGLPKT